MLKSELRSGWRRPSAVPAASWPRHPGTTGRRRQGSCRAQPALPGMRRQGSVSVHRQVRRRQLRLPRLRTRRRLRPAGAVPALEIHRCIARRRRHRRRRARSARRRAVALIVNGHAQARRGHLAGSEAGRGGRRGCDLSLRPRHRPAPTYPQALRMPSGAGVLRKEAGQTRAKRVRNLRRHGGGGAGRRRAVR